MINELTLKVRPSPQYNLFSSKAIFKETFKYLNISAAF